MGKSITIRLVPKEKDKIYKPSPGYADLYVLMNKLHLNSVNEAIEEESQEVSDLQLHLHQTQNALNNNYKEESTLNVIVDNLETLDRKIRKHSLKGTPPEIESTQITDINKIIDESDLSIKDKLERLELNDISKDKEKFIKYLSENLKLLNDRKAQLSEYNMNLNSYISRLDTLKENINSSSTDIDSVEVALRNIKIL